MKFDEIRKHLSRFRVGIAGAGGLGSNCAVALTRCGIGSLVIADHDSVEEPNLNRQYYFTDQIGKAKTIALKENLSRINPETHVVSFQTILDKSNISGIFSGCDVIVEAFDSAEMKKMLIETVQTQLPHIPIVVASGLAGWGKNNTIRFRKIDDTLYICGDESSDVNDDLPPMAPRVGIVANMQANVVVEILMQKSIRQ